MKTGELKIGGLAARLDIPIQTIRYYERERLLPVPHRTEGNYRVYDAALVERLAFIRNCRALDMTLDEIRELLRLRDDPRQECSSVNRLLDEHIEHVSRRIKELQGLRLHLQQLRKRCKMPISTDQCAILEDLSQESDEAVGSGTHLPLHRPVARKAR